MLIDFGTGEASMHSNVMKVYASAVFEDVIGAGLTGKGTKDQLHRLEQRIIASIKNEGAMLVCFDSPLPPAKILFLANEKPTFEAINDRIKQIEKLPPFQQPRNYVILVQQITLHAEIPCLENTKRLTLANLIAKYKPASGSPTDLFRAMHA